MTPTNQDPRLDNALGQIRSMEPDEATMETAAARMRAKLRITTCADYQAMTPAYRAGTLDEAHRLLYKDHIRECVTCRRSAEGERMPAVVAMKPRAQWTRWAMAAGVVLAAGVASWTAYNRFAGAGNDSLTVDVANGQIYRVENGALAVLKAGDRIGGNTEVRAAKGSNAMLTLGDGSKIEMRERSAFSVTRSGRDLTLQLAGGAVLIEAAKDRSRHLYVATRDARVAVTGTVFSVAAGVKGSRVSVVEGEVRVAQAGREHVLHAGDQVASAAVGRIGVEEDIDWSRNKARHLALLGEFSALAKSLERVLTPKMRYESRLIDRLPADTAIFASLPNLTETLAQAERIIQERVGSSPVLAQWWAQADRGDGKTPAKMLAEVKEFSSYLGDEIVIAAALEANGNIGAPVFIAEVRKEGLAEFAATHAKGIPLTVSNGLMMIAPERALSLDGGFAPTEFRASIAKSYRDGVGFLFSADLGRLMPKARQNFGIRGVKTLIVEQKDQGGRPELHASVQFAGERTGLATWLADPAPMRVLDFVSPDAAVATSVVLKNPGQLIQELFAMIESQDPKFRAHLAEVEAELGFSIERDLASALGGEMAFAIDGPLLPMPSWKLIAEVSNGAQLQSAIQKSVDAVNRKAEGKFQVTVTPSVASGRTYYAVKITGVDKALEGHYAFVDGYFVAAATRALIDQAIQSRAAGFTLTKSQLFISLLPKDREANASAVFYQNVGRALKPMMEMLTPEQKAKLGPAASLDLPPTLVTVYGEADRISIATSGDILSAALSNILAAKGPVAMMGKMGTMRPGATY